MSGGQFCTCGRKPLRNGSKNNDLTDLVVMVLKGNYSAFNGYRRERSDYSHVVCLRPNCQGSWRTASSYVFDLPNIEGKPWKRAEMEKQVKERIEAERIASEQSGT